MSTKIRQLYDEAAAFHTQAKAILAEFGDTLPAEKAEQVDMLLDQVEAKTAEAKRLERAEEAEKAL
ncbi:MAG TPA: hypothetical protein PLQ85_13160, partial [Anaerolineae bacterium]|nr:hypothetical protein [Anaerolineae bacterium]